jgi:hypothetical protein
MGVLYRLTRRKNQAYEKMAFVFPERREASFWVVMGENVIIVWPIDNKKNCTAEVIHD